jgi:O-antigen/teichoic acid export membrane protein
MMALQKRIAENLTLSVGGKMASGALAVVALAFTTRALGAEAFGEYTLVLVLLYVFSVFGGFGLDTLLTREISQEGADEKKVIEQIFSARLILLVVFLAAGTGMVFLLPYTMNIKLGMVIASVGAICFSLAQSLTGVFQKYLRIAVPAGAEVCFRGISGRRVPAFLRFSWCL